MCDDDPSSGEKVKYIGSISELPDGRYRVHYHGWAKRYDETLSDDDAAAGPSANHRGGVVPLLLLGSISAVPARQTSRSRVSILVSRFYWQRRHRPGLRLFARVGR